MEHYTNNNQNHFYFDLTPIQINKSQKEVVTVTKKQFYIAPIPKKYNTECIKIFRIQAKYVTRKNI